jgi:hypothetical protein
MFTTAVLPNRQTPQVMTAGANGVARVLGVVMGTTTMKAA